MTLPRSEIDPGRLYSFSEAARYIPSPHPGKTTDTHTLHRWRRKGRLAAVCRTVGLHEWWFVQGNELLRHVPDVEGSPIPMRSAAECRRGYERAMKNLRAAGVVP